MAQRVLHLDFETRGVVDLRKVGAHRYAEDPHTSIICGSYRFDGQPVQSWLGEEPPAEVLEHVADGGRVLAHNAAFERAIWNARIAPGDNARMMPEQQDCTLARGVAAGLPASLEALGSAVRADVQKDKEGHKLMLSMCKPKELTEAGPVWREKPEQLARLAAYCAQDVLSECAVDARVPPLSDRERKIWILNQTLNDRGVLIDMPMAAKAQRLVEFAKKRADERMFQLTNGVVSTCGQVAKIIEWLGTRGILCTSVADGETEELIASAELFADDAAAQVIRLRRASVKAFKFKAMLDAACSDGRVRGSIAYHGAHTGRDAGRIIQPQNMKRLDEDKRDHERVPEALELMRRIHDVRECYEAIEVLVGDPLEVLSVCARAMLVAARGRRFVGGDFSNIEGRKAAWFAGAAWKLNAFRAYDTIRPDGSRAGPDLYKVTAGRVLGKAVEDITKQERQVSGKVTELACQYQGMLNALKKMAAKAGLRIADGVLLNAGRGWREANVEIVAAWRELEDAVVDAVCNPGVVVSALDGKLKFTVSGDFLWMLLPCGRVVWYAQPRVAWVSKKIRTADGDEIEINKRAVSYWGSYQGRQCKIDLYGGMLFNHAVQGSARDVLYDAALEVEAAGYPILLPVHDELLTEPPEGFGSVEDFVARMGRARGWCPGLPLAVAAWEDDRYSK